MLKNKKTLQSRAGFPNGNSSGTAWIYSLLGCGLIFLVWELSARSAGPLLVASPVDTFRKFGELLQHRLFYTQIGITLLRLLVAAFFAGTIGFFLGVLAGVYKKVEMMVEPVRWCFTAVPPIVVTVLLMYYLGTGNSMIVVFSSVILWPSMYINVQKGMQSIDRNLIELNHVFNISKWLCFRRLYWPALSSSYMAGLTQILSGGLRVIILAEIMGAEYGIGAALSDAGRQLEIAEMFVWILMILILVTIMELGILRPLQRRLFAWKKNVNL